MKAGVKFRMVEIPLGYAMCGIPVRFDRDNEHVADARGFWPMKWIAVGRRWFNLPFAEQQAILLHEAGHARGWHKELRVLLLPLFWTKLAARLARNMEFAADAFAARHGGRDALVSFYCRHPQDGPFLPSSTERIVLLNTYRESSP